MAEDKNIAGLVDSLYVSDGGLNTESLRLSWRTAIEQCAAGFFHAGIAPYRQQRVVALDLPAVA